MTSVQTPLEETQAWIQLKTLSLQMKETISDLFDQDPKRASRFSVQLDEFFLDYSKNNITTDILDALFALAASRSLKPKIKQLMSGYHVNFTEDRAAWHTALRQVEHEDEEMPEPIKQAILSSKQQMSDWVTKLNQGYVGASGKKIQHIIHLGIGGSDLGPRLVMDALKPYHQSSLDIHFVSNIDPQELMDVLEHCDPESTMFILASKSFTTLEMLENARLAKAWLQASLLNDVSGHFLAITANKTSALSWGIKDGHILPIWDWVGGRYSIWSSIGLPVAIKIGMSSFNQFLEGGFEMDKHFKTAAIQQNIPVLLALIGIWNNNFLKAKTMAVLPYDHRLRKLPDYIQQLDMESNGKSIHEQARAVEYATGPIIWGQAGTNGQHAFYQLLHQGTHLVPCDFILTARCEHENKRQHELLLANGLAQSQALMVGEANPESAFNTYSGNKPSNTILLKELSPKTLGMLLAMYEHKIFVQGLIWNINSFDQPGVELGKKLASRLADGFAGKNLDLDESTKQLLEKIKTF